VTQVGWLYPIAGAGVVLGLVALRRARRSGAPIDSLSVGLLFSTAYLLTLVLVLGVISLPHTAYLASMALPLAILAAIGGTLLWRAYRRRQRGWKYALPITLVVQCAWTCVVVAGFPAFASWIIPITTGVGGVGSVLLVLAARGPRSRASDSPFVAAGALALVLLAPIVWSVSTLNLAFAGSPNDAYAGPHPVSLFNPPSRPTATYGSGLSSNRARPGTAANEDAAYDYANARASALTYVLATDSWRSDAPLIMDDARRTLAIGGFTSKAPFPDVAQIEDLVQSRQLRFLLLTGQSDKNVGPTPQDLQFRSWAQKNCVVVPVKDYAPGSSSPDVLYDCRKAW
jgi:4-amino-4-deoxy-L-arabinose transferase-like glycosyltransferase